MTSPGKRTIEEVLADIAVLTAALAELLSGAAAD
jgi:hypothetical protein